MMVVAMHNVNEFLGPFAFPDGMKRKTMHQIFEKGPEKHASAKDQEYDSITDIKPEMTQVEEIKYYGQIHAPDDERMCFRHHFHIMVAE
jgi:hypothetical protein